MVATTLAAVAFSGLLAPGASGALPSWQSNYSTALTAAVAQQKPMAVFIGKGEAGPAQLLNGGQLPSKVTDVLSASYVSVYVDTDTAAGKALAGEFGINEGVVISTKGAKLQAMRHGGALTASQLSDYLTRYADTTTVAHTAGYGGCAGGSCYGGGYGGGYGGSSCYSGCYSGGYSHGCGSGGGRRGGRCR